jgi:hypothetical protein
MHISHLLASLALVSACAPAEEPGPDTSLDELTATIAPAGNGTGTITSTPAGIDCGADCSEVFPGGTVVTLHAAAAADSTFAGWSDGPCSGIGDCTLDATGALTVQAMFTVEQHTLTVSTAGGGAGTVTSNLSGIDCGTTCAQPYSPGTSVVLTASPRAGSAFMGWSGSCSGTGTCTVSMTSARNVTATFLITLSCTTITNVASCTLGPIAPLDRGPLSDAACRADCQTAMPAAGMTSGCWIVASDTHCYCRSGTIGTGGAATGGTCN